MLITASASLPVPGTRSVGTGRWALSGHLGRVGGRQVVAVLALGGGLLLGPVLPAQANEDGAGATTGDTGSVTTAPGSARDLASAVLGPEVAEHRGGREPGRAEST